MLELILALLMQLQDASEYRTREAATVVLERVADFYDYRNMFTKIKTTPEIDLRNARLYDKLVNRFDKQEEPRSEYDYEDCGCGMPGK